MPGMNGFETAALIRQRDRSRYMPIIFLTAGGKTETEMFQGYAVGAIDYLLKPIRPAILRSKVLVLADLYRKTNEVSRLRDELSHQAREFEALSLALKTKNESHERTGEELRRSQEAFKSLNTNLEARVAERVAAAGDRGQRPVPGQGEPGKIMEEGIRL
jgi:DNA-binding response OmpR family regulator